MLSNIEQITRYRHLLVDNGQITGQIAGYRGQTKLSVTAVRSDWFQYSVIVSTIESIPVVCNHYFSLLNKFVKLNFLSSCCNLTATGNGCCACPQDCNT